MILKNVDLAKIYRPVQDKDAADMRLLPENTLLVGEHTGDSVKIYVAQTVYKIIHYFAKDKQTNESGGFLVGYPHVLPGRITIIIDGVIEARHCEATPTTLQFSPETWSYCHDQLEKHYPGRKLVGWFHTHPNLGTFFSEHDRSIQERFFSEDFQLCYIIDPVRKDETFYLWLNEGFQRFRGFFLYDKPGVKITLEDAGAPPPRPPALGAHLGLRDFALAASLVAVFLLSFALGSLHLKLNRLENSIYTIVDGANQSLTTLNSNYIDLQLRLDRVERLLNAELSDTAAGEIGAADGDPVNGDGDGDDDADAADGGGDTATGQGAATGTGTGAPRTETPAGGATGTTGSGSTANNGGPANATGTGATGTGSSNSGGADSGGSGSNSGGADSGGSGSNTGSDTSTGATETGSTDGEANQPANSQYDPAAGDSAATGNSANGNSDGGSSDGSSSNDDNGDDTTPQSNQDNSDGAAG